MSVVPYRVVIDGVAGSIGVHSQRAGTGGDVASFIGDGGNNFVVAVIGVGNGKCPGAAFVQHEIAVTLGIGDLIEGNSQRLTSDYSCVTGETGQDIWCCCIA